MMKYFLLASGSRGNSLFVQSANGRFLIDVGLSATQVSQILVKKDIDPTSVDAILLTHSHSDHTRGVQVFANRYKIPIYAHPETLIAIERHLKPGQVTESVEAAFQIKDVQFQPFRLSHDCDPTHGYLVKTGGKTLALCTDTGIVTDKVKSMLQNVDAIILESNHDPRMLANGPYPQHLKERVSGRTGHLSNQDAGELLQEIMHTGLRQIVLAHLSDKNNTPGLALRTVLDCLGPQYEDRIYVARQRSVSETFILD